METKVGLCTCCFEQLESAYNKILLLIITNTLEIGPSRPIPPNHEVAAALGIGYWCLGLGCFETE
jgi:hypothetical protein